MSTKTCIIEGYEINYEPVFIEHYRTGHIGCEFECGTCDGARCERCHEVWRVVESRYKEDRLETVWHRFDNGEDAREYADGIEVLDELESEWL